ncbi:hypothetical protein KP509_11G095400 [Ceratopteris richardii]|nr:hypothetical protein KP509_11G095400 [Ceratopteris richardii]
MYVFGGFGPLIGSANGDDNGSEEDGQDGSDRSDNQAMIESDDEESEEEDEDAAMSFTWFDDLYVLDVVSNIWQKVETTGLKPSPRAAHAAFITKVPGDSKIGRLVVFGGRDPVGRQNDMYSLDLQAMQWKKETSICPPARSFHSLVQLGDSLFAVCYGGVGASGEMFPGLEVLNVETMEWTSLKSSSGTWPSLRGASALVWNLNKEACQVIMFGGSCSIEDRDPLYFNDCYIFDMSSLLKGV